MKLAPRMSDMLQLVVTKRKGATDLMLFRGDFLFYSRQAKEPLAKSLFSLRRSVMFIAHIALLRSEEMTFEESSKFRH